MANGSMPAYSYTAKEYCLLTKPGIILGNVITTAAGFALASRGEIDFWKFLAVLMGLSLVIGSACVFNNYIDRHADEKMARTKNRPLVVGSVSKSGALLFAVILGFAGTFLLAYQTNLLTTLIALFGFLVYVILYSFSKYRSIHGTLIGSVAGAVPPVVGYCAVSNHLDAGAWILFAMMAMWQMPHFFAIAIYRLEDYVKASIPLLPIKKGIRTAKVHMCLYTLAFIAASAMLTLFGYTNLVFLIVATLLGAVWLGLCLKGFQCKSDKLWARQMFLFSLLVVMVQSFMIPLTVV